MKSEEPEMVTRERIGEREEKAIVSPAETTEKKEVENADVEELEIEPDPVGLSDDIQNIMVILSNRPFLF